VVGDEMMEDEQEGAERGQKGQGSGAQLRTPQGPVRA